MNPDLLDLRQDRDLGDILGTLLVVAGLMIYHRPGGDPGTRIAWKNILNIFKRGMGESAPPRKSRTRRLHNMEN